MISQTPENSTKSLGEYKDIFNYYENGKHRRYELLFAVNGGAMAIAKLFSDPNTARFLGNLSLDTVAYSLAVFTVLMGVDIGVFGQRMRKAAGDNYGKWTEGIFSIWGKFILGFVCVLIAGAWLLVV